MSDPLPSRPAPAPGMPSAAAQPAGAREPLGAAPASPAPQGPGRRALGARFGAAALLVALDLWSKAYIFAWMGSGPEGLVRDAHGHLRFPLVGDWLAWMLSRNPGAAFGGFASVPRLLVGGRIAAVLFLIWLLARTPPGRRLFGAALVLVLGGALGNLWDNLFEPRPSGLPFLEQLFDLSSSASPFGEVRDFIDVYFRFDWTVPLVGWRWDVDWHFPTFNVADSCITVGAILLLLSGLFREGEAQERKARSQAS